MPYEISYYSDRVKDEIARLPKTIVARYFKLTDRMELFGPDLGMPHTRAMGHGLFELRIMGGWNSQGVLLHFGREADRDAA